MVERRQNVREVRYIPRDCLCEVDVVEKDDRRPIVIRVRDNDCEIHGIINEAWQGIPT